MWHWRSNIWTRSARSTRDRQSLLEFVSRYTLICVITLVQGNRLVKPCSDKQIADPVHKLIQQCSTLWTLIFLLAPCSGMAQATGMLLGIIAIVFVISRRIWKSLNLDTYDNWYRRFVCNPRPERTWLNSCHYLNAWKLQANERHAGQTAHEKGQKKSCYDCAYYSEKP